MQLRSIMSVEPKPAAAKKNLIASVVVILLSLGTWSFFYIKAMPLSSSDTAVVVGTWLVVVFAAKWLWENLKGTRRKADNA